MNTRPESGIASISKVSGDLKSVMFQNQDLQKTNVELQEQLVDLKGRSMRDNLLFYNFSESKSNHKNELCMDILYDSCEVELHMKDVRLEVKIDWAHRLGAPKRGKRRPIVAKFNYFQDKELIKRRASEKLQNSKFSIGDQFP